MKYLKETILICLILMVGFMSLGCSSRKDNENLNENVEFEDCAGRKITLTKKVERIVDLTFLEGVRTLIELEAEDYLVGMSEMDHQAFNKDGMLKNSYLIVSQAAPGLKNVVNVGNHNEINVEKIMSLNPDVVFVEWSKKDYADKLQAQINIPVVCVGGYGSFNYEIFSVVGKIVGKEDRAEELIEYTKTKLEAITKVTENIPEDKKKKIFYWVRPYIGDPRTNGRYEAFELAGAKNVARGDNNTPYGVYKITKEQILDWNPDYIFKHSSFIKDVEGWHTIESIKEDKIISGTIAAKNNCILPTKGHMRGWDIATEATEVFYLAKIMYPNKFMEIDVEKECNEILKKFYGIDNLYTDMSNKLRLHNIK